MARVPRRRCQTQLAHLARRSPVPLIGIARHRREDVLLLKELVEEGKYRPVIDRSYPLEQVVDATEYVETGQKTGNVVLTVLAD